MPGRGALLPHHIRSSTGFKKKITFQSFSLNICEKIIAWYTNPLKEAPMAKKVAKKATKKATKPAAKTKK